MKKCAVAFPFQWASTSTPSPQFGRPKATHGKLSLLAGPANGNLVALSPNDRKWAAKLREYVDFIEAHGRPPSRRGMDAPERSLAEWWRGQVDLFNEGKLNEYRVGQLVRAELIVSSSQPIIPAGRQ